MDIPEQVSIAGHLLTCPHCRHDRFFKRSWLLNTTGMTFLDLDWLNTSATNYVCAECGRIEWFTTPPHKPSLEDTLDGDTECLECGATIPHGTASCQKCGWSYR